MSRDGHSGWSKKYEDGWDRIFKKCGTCLYFFPTGENPYNQTKKTGECKHGTRDPILGPPPDFHEDGWCENHAPKNLESEKGKVSSDLGVPASQIPDVIDPDRDIQDTEPRGFEADLASQPEACSILCDLGRGSPVPHRTNKTEPKIHPRVVKLSSSPRIQRDRRGDSGRLKLLEDRAG